MIFDPIANMISTIKNGYSSNKDEVSVSFSVFKEKIAQILVEEKYLDSVEIKDHKNKTWKQLVIKLRYENKKPAISDISQVSKTSLRVYVPFKKLPKVLGGLGTSILSTPRGVLSTKQAKKLHLGGEVICNVW